MYKLSVFLLYFVVHASIADVHQLSYIMKNNLIYDGEQLKDPDQRKCYEILEDFATHASNFTLCSIVNARPIRLCEKCIDYYVQFQQKYQELLNTVVNGTNCGSLFMSHDRLNTVQLQHDNLLAVWYKGNCNNCFKWVKEGPILKNTTNNFMQMYNDTIDCIITNMKSPDNIVCETCMEKYLQLDEFYKSLSTDSIGVDSVCMDIVDSMNSTRSIWSKTLKCCNLRRSPEILFLCCAGIMSCLPLLYYLAVRFCGPIRDLPNVLKQSRFKQSLLRNIDNRND